MERLRFITGGDSDIGLATAKRFVNEGAYVFSAERRKSKLDVAVKEMGKNVTAVQGDVANFDDLDRLFAQIKKQTSKLDILFANAGIAKYAPFATITEEFLTAALLKSESHEYYYRHHRAVADATRITKGARTSESRHAEPQACCSG